MAQQNEIVVDANGNPVDISKFKEVPYGSTGESKPVVNMAPSVSTIKPAAVQKSKEQAVDADGNPVDISKFKEVPHVSPSDTKPDEPAVPPKPAEDTGILSDFGKRAGLSLSVDNAEAKFMHGQDQASSTPLLKTAIHTITNPYLSVLNGVMPSLTPTEAQEAFNNGTLKQQTTALQQQLENMPKHNFLSNPGRWMEEAVGNHAAAAVGLGLGAATIYATKGTLIPSPATVTGFVKAAAAGSVASLGAGAIAKLFNKDIIDKPENPEDPSDPYYSPENQNKITNVKDVSDVASMVGGGFATGLKRTPYLSKISGDVAPILAEASEHASNLLDMAKKYNVNVDDLPTNPDFVTFSNPPKTTDPMSILQQRVNEAQGFTRNAHATNTLNSDVVSGTVPAINHNLVKEIGTPTYNDAANAGQSFDESIKGWNNNKKSVLQPYYNLIDKHGILPEYLTKIQETLQNIMKRPDISAEVGKLYGDGSFQWNTSTAGMRSSVSNEEALTQENIPTIASFVDAVQNIKQNYPLSEAGRSAGKVLSEFLPVLNEAKDKSFIDHLTNPDIMGAGKKLTKKEAVKLQNGINAAYGQGDETPIPNGFAGNRNTYSKEFAPDIYSNTSNKYDQMAANLTQKQSGIAALTDRMAKHDIQLKDLMTTKEYKKAFGVGDAIENKTYGYNKDQSWQELHNSLDSSANYASNNLGRVLFHGLATGVRDGSISTGDKGVLNGFLQRSADATKDIKSFLSQNPKTVDMMFHTNDKKEIVGAKSYQEMLQGLLTSNDPQATRAVLDHLNRWDNPSNYDTIKEEAASHFMTKTYSALTSKTPEGNTDIVNLAHKYQATFGDAAHPIVVDAMKRIGTAMKNPDPNVVKAVADKAAQFLLPNAEGKNDFSERIQKVRAGLIKSTPSLTDRLVDWVPVQTKPFKIMLTTLDYIGKALDMPANIAEKIPGVKGAAPTLRALNPLSPVNKANIDRAIKDSLTSQANYEAAMKKITSQKERMKMQIIKNTVTGGMVGH